MPLVSPARVIERLLGSSEAKAAAQEIAAEDLAQRQALVSSIAEHQRDYTADDPRLAADIDQAKDAIPAARKIMRQALQEHASALRARELTLNAHLQAVTESQAELTRLAPPFLKVAIHETKLGLQEVERESDGSLDRATKREGLKWTLLALTELQLTAEPTPADVDAIQRQSPSVGQLRMGVWKVREMYQTAARYSFAEVRGLEKFATNCLSTLRALTALDPHDPNLGRDVEKLRTKLRSNIPSVLRGDAW